MKTRRTSVEIVVLGKPKEIILSEVFCESCKDWKDINGGYLVKFRPSKGLSYTCNTCGWIGRFRSPVA